MNKINGIGMKAFGSLMESDDDSLTYAAMTVPPFRGLSYSMPEDAMQVKGYKTIAEKAVKNKANKKKGKAAAATVKRKIQCSKAYFTDSYSSNNISRVIGNIILQLYEKYVL